MLELEVYNKKGKVVDKVGVKEELFGAPINKAILYEALKMYLANRRQGTAATKTRAEVSGGGRKPYPQKHTGRARAGSIRSPIWRGGGVVFGPKPRDYSYTIPKKKKKLAFCSALTSLREEGKIKILDKVEVKEGKTKELEEILNNLQINKKILLVVDKASEEIKRAAKNIPYLRLRDPLCLNTYDLLTTDWLLFTVDSLKKLEEKRV